MNTPLFLDLALAAVLVVTLFLRAFLTNRVTLADTKSKFGAGHITNKIQSCVHVGIVNYRYQIRYSL